VDFSSWYILVHARQSLVLKKHKFFQPSMKVINDIVSCGNCFRLPNFSKVIAEYVEGAKENIDFNPWKQCLNLLIITEKKE